MKFLFQSSILLAIVVAIVSCNKPGVERDMVHFDEAYVPVLYYVYKNDMDKATNSMYLLNARWQQFQNKYHYIFKDDADGMERLRYVDDWLGDASHAIFQNDRHTALMQLDHVKYEMMEIRRSYKVEYFLDYLWDFEGALSMLGEASCNDISLVCSADELAFLIDETQYLWEIVVEARNVPFTKIIDKETLMRFELYKKEVTKNMRRVEAEKYGSIENIASSVDDTYDSFMNLLTLFGDFNSVQTFYANELQQ